MAYRKTEFVERKRLETRSRIVSAAADLVRKAGWKGCLLKAVAERAGVATGSIYTHFSKITDLYKETYSVIAEEELAVMARLAMSDGAPTERLRAALDRFTGRAIRGRVQAYAMIGEPVAAEVDALRQKYRRRFAEPFEAIIREGVATSEFVKQDPVSAAACILGALSEAMISPLAPEAMAQKDQGRALRRKVREFCMRAVGAEVAAKDNNKVARA